MIEAQWLSTDSIFEADAESMMAETEMIKWFFCNSHCIRASDWRFDGAELCRCRTPSSEREGRLLALRHGRGARRRLRLRLFRL